MVEKEPKSLFLAKITKNEEFNGNFIILGKTYALNTSTKVAGNNILFDVFSFCKHTIALTKGQQ